MHRRWRVGIGLGLVAGLVACGRPGPDPVAELQAAVTAYQQGAADGTEERVQVAFAKVDAEVARVRADELAQPVERRGELTRRRQELEAERQAQLAAYTKAKIARIGTAATDAMKEAGRQLGEQLEAAGKRMREAMQDAPAE